MARSENEIAFVNVSFLSVLVIISLARLLFSPSIIQQNVIYWLKDFTHLAGIDGNPGGDRGDTTPPSWEK